MRFTYLPEEETIVMSTNRKTKKYDMLERQSGVVSSISCACLNAPTVFAVCSPFLTNHYVRFDQALLVHDFAEATPPKYSFHIDVGEDDGANKLTGEYSITLNGTCSVVKDGERNVGL